VLALARVNSDVRRHPFAMAEHDPRCDVSEESDQQVLDDVAKLGWHVMNVLNLPDSPGWAFSIGLYKTFKHPEVVVFGLNPDLMHSIINSVGEAIRSGKQFKDGEQYPDLIEAYSCMFKTVNAAWYQPFLGYANWFYGGTDYPVLQCIWPDKESLYPWDDDFNPNWLYAQPLFFHAEPTCALATDFLRTINGDAGN
jgi:hypothetical protein